MQNKAKLLLSSFGEQEHPQRFILCAGVSELRIAAAQERLRLLLADDHGTDRSIEIRSAADDGFAGMRRFERINIRISVVFILSPPSQDVGIRWGDFFVLKTCIADGLLLFLQSEIS